MQPVTPGQPGPVHSDAVAGNVVLFPAQGCPISGAAQERAVSWRAHLIHLPVPEFACPPARRQTIWERLHGPLDRMEQAQAFAQARKQAAALRRARDAAGPPKSPDLPRSGLPAPGLPFLIGDKNRGRND